MPINYRFAFVPGVGLVQETTITIAGGATFSLAGASLVDDAEDTDGEDDGTPTSVEEGVFLK